MSIWGNRISIVEKNIIQSSFFGKSLPDTCHIILTCNVKKYTMKMKKWILEQVLSSL